MDQLFSNAPEEPGPSPAYRVLARKYRPSSFADLIGQDAMVRTLRNAFARNRIPQAWMLTGVRGVGKTTTARILARGLNYQLPDGTGAPTVDMDRMGIHCQSIIEGNHIDVMEIDAASNNGVENVRQLTDSVRYAPTSARYKVYIIDEVHMLSPGAFNAFLKTLEEPPPHVKFVFATTEIRKVPVTILSRCQRFDLRRVESAVLIGHLRHLCELEKVTAEDEALSLIARAAEGSVRDAMSLLDQAIAHGAGGVTAEDVRLMLGLADRTRLLDLFEMLMAGQMAQALEALRSMYQAGSDPTQVIADLADIAHLATRLKILPQAARDPSLTEAERVRGLGYAERLSMPALSRAWQVLSRGLLEVQASNKPVAAAEMLLIRLAYAANLPTPDDALRALAQKPASGGGDAPRVEAPRPNGSPARAERLAAPVQGAGVAAALRREALPREEPSGPRLDRFEDVIALARDKRDLTLQYALERDVRLVSFERGRIEFEPAPGARDDLAKTIARRLLEWTGERWLVAISTASGASTVGELRDVSRKSAMEEAGNAPLVRAILDRFPGAEIVDVRERGARDDASDDEAQEELLAVDPDLGDGDGFEPLELPPDDDI